MYICTTNNAPFNPADAEKIVAKVIARKKNFLAESTRKAYVARGLDIPANTSDLVPTVADVKARVESSTLGLGSLSEMFTHTEASRNIAAQLVTIALDKIPGYREAVKRLIVHMFTLVQDDTSESNKLTTELKEAFTLDTSAMRGPGSERGFDAPGWQIGKCNNPFHPIWTLGWYSAFPAMRGSDKVIADDTFFMIMSREVGSQVGEATATMRGEQFSAPQLSYPALRSAKNIGDSAPVWTQVVNLDNSWDKDWERKPFATYYDKFDADCPGGDYTERSPLSWVLCFGLSQRRFSNFRDYAKRLIGIRATDETIAKAWPMHALWPAALQHMFSALGGVGFGEMMDKKGIDTASVNINYVGSDDTDALSLKTPLYKDIFWYFWIGQPILLRTRKWKASSQTWLTSSTAKGTIKVLNNSMTKLNNVFDILNSYTSEQPGVRFVTLGYAGTTDGVPYKANVNAGVKEELTEPAVAAYFATNWISGGGQSDFGNSEVFATGDPGDERFQALAQWVMNRVVNRSEADQPIADFTSEVFRSRNPKTGYITISLNFSGNDFERSD